MLISDFIKKEAKGLPVFILLDNSGSMCGEKIGTVNVCLKEMINSFKKIENPKGVIKLCLITFGDDKVEVIKNLSKIEDSDVYTLTAGGNTPMGKAFEKVSEMIEDPSIVPSTDYTPTICLISDGNPTDYRAGNESVEDIKLWPELQKLLSGRRSSKAVKVAMGIGNDMNRNILKAFINNDEIPVITAKDGNTISKFFEWVTMSVSVRSVSANPNKPIMAEPVAFDDDEMEF